jgi:phosphoribosyl-ATP pyrophosphohydrolase / phosphoribosyl-AMP cyclohydrolase / histidinol dehydrogenase
MTSTPYPSFRKYSPIDPSRGLASIAVGRCRLHPTSDQISDVLELNLRQAQLLNPTPAAAARSTDTAEEETKQQEEIRKRQRKKAMKEGVALAKQYLEDVLGGHCTVSVVAVEVALEAADLVATQGCLACCFLDAGCQTIVVVDSSKPYSSSSSSNNAEDSPGQTSSSSLSLQEEALRLLSTILPVERLCGHFAYSPTPEFFRSIDAVHLTHCSAVSSTLTAQDTNESTLLSIVESILAMKSGRGSGGGDGEGAGINPESSPTVVSSGSVTVHVPADAASPAVVASVCRPHTSHQDMMAVTIALIDPTSQQLGEAYCGCLKTDRDDRLYTTVVCNRNNEALGLVYSSVESLVAALACGRGVYWSRSRGSLWRKGDTSGHVQTLHRIDVDCDGDALRFTVTQETPANAAAAAPSAAPAFCHLNTLTCWGMPHGLRLLELTLQDRLRNAPEGSYTKRLFDDDVLLRNKLVEEAQELSEANDRRHVAEELADLLYFAMVKAVKSGVSLDDAVVELDKRTRKVTRRQGDSKEFRIAAGRAILNQKAEPEGAAAATTSGEEPSS